jgi:hypothetical protein
LVLGRAGYDQTQTLLFPQEDDSKNRSETTGLLVLSGDK